MCLFVFILVQFHYSFNMVSLLHHHLSTDVFTNPLSHPPVGQMLWGETIIYCLDFCALVYSVFQGTSVIGSKVSHETPEHSCPRLSNVNINYLWLQFNSTSGIVLLCNISLKSFVRNLSLIMIGLYSLKRMKQGEICSHLEMMLEEMTLSTFEKQKTHMTSLFKR